LSPQFRRAGPADAALLHRLLAAMAAEDGAEIASSPETLRQHGFGPEPRFRAVLAEDGDAPLGLVIFFPEYSTWRGQIGVFVQDLYLSPPARGTGLGRALLAAALRHAADWQPQFLTLMVDQKNAAARGFYSRLGFAPRSGSDPLILSGPALSALGAP
jgi:GNAT superfamily N-acetyltransferase